MDTDEIELLRESMVATLTRRTDVLGALRDDGFEEMRAQDHAVALGTLFEVKGAELVDAPVLRLVVPPSSTNDIRTVPVLPLPGQTAPARVAGSSVELDGLVVGEDVAPDMALLVGCSGADESSQLVLVPGERVHAARIEGIDPAARLTRVSATLTRSKADTWAGNTWPWLRDEIRVCLAHELIGVAERMNRQVTDFVLARSQFGRPLGSWQTVQHRLADIAIGIAAARAAVAAAWQAPRSLTAAAAKSQAAAAATAAGAGAQQMTGALGFTWEFGLHRAIRRTQLLDALLGTRAELNEEIGAELAGTRRLEAFDVRY